MAQARIAVDRIASPTVVAFNSQAGGHPQAAAPGQLIDALVLQLIDATTARVSVAGTAIDLPTQIPLVPGAIVRLAVRGHGTDTKFVIVGMSPRNTVDPAQKPAADQVTLNSTAGAAPGVAAAGLADEDGVAQAPHSAGVEQGAVPPKPVDPRPANSNPTVALATAMRAAAARQVGLAPLFADAAEALAVPQLPAPVRQALTTLLAFPVSVEHGVTGGGIKQGLEQSGIFLEAHLADQRVPFSPSPDLKLSLLAVRHVLAQWSAHAQLAASATVELQGKESAADRRGDAATDHASHPPVVSVKTPPPPYRGAPTAGQAPAAVSLEPHASLDVIRETLIERTDGALARMTLLQSASLADAAGPLQARGEPAAPHWSFEIPFVAPPLNPAVAHFEIARDGHNSSPQDPKAPVWRANFSIDIEPIGPVHAQVAVTGNRAAVRLWAERKGSAAALRANSPELTEALHRVALEATELLVRDGVPPRPVKPPAGRFVDRAS